MPPSGGCACSPDMLPGASASASANRAGQYYSLHTTNPALDHCKSGRDEIKYRLGSSRVAPATLSNAHGDDGRVLHADGSPPSDTAAASPFLFLSMLISSFITWYLLCFTRYPGLVAKTLGRRWRTFLGGHLSSPGRHSPSPARKRV